LRIYSCIYQNVYLFEWDADNARKTAAHSLTTLEVESAFVDNFAMDGDAQVVDGEDRFVLFGMTFTGRIVRVIYTNRRESLRVVTAHEATRGQRQRYEQHRSKMLEER
jgi:uncharacterized protein